MQHLEHIPVKALVVFLLVIVSSKLSSSKPATIFAQETNTPNNNCRPVKREVLRERLGHAFNHHYMAMDFIDIKEKVSDRSELANIIDELDPAYLLLNFDTGDHDNLETDHVPEKAEHVRSGPYHVNGSMRDRRSSGSIRIGDIQDPTPWTCQTKVRWERLGANYFPRYLRTVTCTQPLCWYGHFSCRPKLFKLKVLKKKQNTCRQITSLRDGHRLFEEFWEVVEKEVALYCQCTQ
ncbi:protein trunk isoform X2 [Nematostella vectensis]|uniref:protein trunk isoform X2 n=1 Tax=Nematostella vectensis TaxID=45351 RepID=UPI002077072E|nr:protein trunk isoform X2 [Nematostella vectensis]